MPLNLILKCNLYL